MAFLDNSGDIILDAVLTDTGRYRLAKGDGSFKIVKFALSDDEINYKLYNKNNPSGSAYYDLEILQTPIMEAFTNNTSTMNYKLLSIPRTNLLYLPIMKINNEKAYRKTQPANGGYLVTVTNGTWDRAEGSTLSPPSTLNPGGILSGEDPTKTASSIRIDQGIDNIAISYQNQLDSDLKETQYIIEIDSRLGMVASVGANATNAAISFVDDDNIGSYYISDAPYVQNILGASGGDVATFGWQDGGSGAPTTALGNSLVIAGPQGTALEFKIRTTLEIITSDYLFDTLGGTITGAALNTTWGFQDNTGTYKFIDSVIKVTGATTGYKLNIPIRFVKRIT